jgi:predicted dehydrogenase
LFEGGFLNVEPLINHRIPFDDATRAYSILSEEKNTLGIILNYDSNKELMSKRTFPLRYNECISSPLATVDNPGVGFIGAGNYASRILIPAFKRAGVRLHTIASNGGTNASIHGRKNGFEYATSNTDELLAHPDINTIVIATRHNTHAKLAIKALEAGKHVFVEKPLALSIQEVNEVQNAFEKAKYLQLMVGFNRRFAPMVQKMKQLIDSVTEPKNFIMTINAGSLPLDHWHYDRRVGGGRIISEGCHFIDLLRYLSGSEISMVKAISVGSSPAIKYRHDKVSINLCFTDGSLGTIFYLANGSPSFPKEQLDVFCAGRVLRLNNYKKLTGWGWQNFSKISSFSQNKGQNECAKAFTNSVINGDRPAILINELLEVSRITIEASGQVDN